MANIQITQLPAAGAITGTESVPIVQNGQTVQTTTGAISASPSQPYQYLTVIQTPQLQQMVLRGHKQQCLQMRPGHQLHTEAEYLLRFLVVLQQLQYQQMELLGKE